MTIIDCDAIADFNQEDDPAGALELLVLILTDRKANRTRAAFLEVLLCRVSRSVTVHDADLFRNEIAAILDVGPRRAVESGRVSLSDLIDLVRDPVLLRRLYDFLSRSMGPKQV